MESSAATSITLSTDRVHFETLISDISARFVAAPPEHVEPVVEAALDDVRNFFGADRCLLLSVSPDEMTVRVAYGAYGEGLPSLPEELNLAALFPWCRVQLLVERTPVIVFRRADLPPDAAVDVVSSDEAVPVLSNLAVPLTEGPVTRHIVVIHWLRQECEFPESYASRLRVLGEMMLNALKRKQALEELRTSEERLGRAAESAGCGLWELDPAGGQFWVTAETRRLYGLAPDGEANWERFVGLLHPADRDRVTARVASVLAGGGLLDERYRIVRDDGAVRWMHAIARRDGRGRLLGASVDETDRIEAERRATEESARVAAAVEAAGLGFSEWTTGNDWPLLDGRALDLLGILAEEKSNAGELWAARLEASDRSAVERAHRELAAGEAERLTLEYRYQHPQRGPLWLRHSFCRLGPEPDGRVRLIGAVEDVTQRKRHEEHLQRLSEQLAHENLYLRQEARRRLGPEHIVGRSEAIRKTLRLAEQVAATDSTVLLRGETGSGKERFASFIHECSRRSDRPMIVVNCSAIPSTLLESELFGREKGAYTGALSRQVGRFELAQGSTIFLDEIGELPVETQVKLLRVLENRTIERLGSPRPVPIDVRIIAATHRDLEQAVREGRFREDLYYRLNVFPIVVPPLRERREDIPLLVQAFVDELTSTVGKNIEDVDDASMAELVTYPWPGNVRELRNIVERAMIMATGPTLHIDLPHDGAGCTGSQPDAMREQILRVLQDTGWRIRGAHGAAARLGLKPTTLEWRLRKLGLARPGARATSTE